MTPAALADPPVEGNVSAPVLAKMEALSQESGESFWVGAATLDGDGDGKVELVALVKALQGRGFGAPPVAESGDGGGRRGRRDTSKSDIEFLKRLDANKDKMVDRAEAAGAFKAALQSQLDAKLSLDADKDGKISLQEYALSSPAKGDKVDENGVNWHQRSHFEREDPNKDGFISAEEVFERHQRGVVEFAEVMQLSLRLGAADADGDQSLSVEECDALVPGWRRDEGALELKQAYHALQSTGAEERAALTKALDSDR